LPRIWSNDAALFWLWLFVFAVVVNAAAVAQRCTQIRELRNLSVEFAA
jgi:hypothetical protein